MVSSDTDAKRAALAARRLARRGAKARERPEELSRPPVAPLSSQFGMATFLGEHTAFIEQQLAEIRAAYEGVRLVDRYRVDEVAIADGRCLRLRHSTSIGALRLPAAELVRRVLSSRLDLVRGIGPYRRASFHQRGVLTLFELADPSSPASYQAEAGVVLAEIAACDLTALHERLRVRLGGRGQILAALLAAMVDLSDIGFLDVETLGLANEPIFLVGVGRFVGDAFVVDQYLAPQPADEPAALAAGLDALAGTQLLVTYNGRTADVPWIRSRCFYHGLPSVPQVAHLDLLYGTRRRWIYDEDRLPDARLPTVQRQLLGLDRPAHDVPSHLVPQFYDAYVASSDDECLLVPIIDHNRSDIEALASLLELLCAEALALDGAVPG
jgi:uncharacterized protein YprB with RNaseH-like and TPR domain